jgi:hypothetical protein
MDTPQRGSTLLLSQFFRSNLDTKPFVVKDKDPSTSKEERLLQKMNFIQRNWQDNEPTITHRNLPGCIRGDAYATKTGIELFNLEGVEIHRMLFSNPFQQMMLEVPEAKKISNEDCWKSFGCVAATKHHIAINGPNNNAIYLFDNKISNEQPKKSTFNNSFLVDDGVIQQLHMVGSSLFARVTKTSGNDLFNEWLYVFDVEDTEKKPEIISIPITEKSNYFLTWDNFKNQLCFGNTHVMGVKELPKGYQLFTAPLTNLNVRNKQSPFCLFEKVDSISTPRIFAEEDHFIVVTKTEENKFNVLKIDLKDGFRKEIIAENIELLDEGYRDHAIFYYLGRLFSAHLKSYNDHFAFSSYDLLTGMKMNLGTSPLIFSNHPFKPRFVLTLDTTRKVATVNFIGQGFGKTHADVGLGNTIEIVSQITSFEYGPSAIQENLSNSPLLLVKA